MKKPNRLIREKSPYLLQHAHNPVDWYPWGEEAFEKGKFNEARELLTRLITQDQLAEFLTLPGYAYLD